MRKERCLSYVLLKLLHERFFWSDKYLLSKIKIMCYAYCGLLGKDVSVFEIKCLRDQQATENSEHKYFVI
jgi:hypothetical protein